MNIKVEDSYKNVYIVDDALIKLEIKAFEDCSFDCLFNNISAYDSWISLTQKRKDDEYFNTTFDQYLHEYGEHYELVYTEDYMTNSEFKEYLSKYKYYYDSEYRNIYPTYMVLENTSLIDRFFSVDKYIEIEGNNVLVKQIK